MQLSQIPVFLCALSGLALGQAGQLTLSPPSNIETPCLSWGDLTLQHDSTTLVSIQVPVSNRCRHQVSPSRFRVNLKGSRNTDSYPLLFDVDGNQDGRTGPLEPGETRTLCTRIDSTTPLFIPESWTLRPVSEAELGDEVPSQVIPPPSGWLFYGAFSPNHREGRVAFLAVLKLSERGTVTSVNDLVSPAGLRLDWVQQALKSYLFRPRLSHGKPVAAEVIVVGALDDGRGPSSTEVPFLWAEPEVVNFRALHGFTPDGWSLSFEDCRVSGGQCCPKGSDGYALMTYGASWAPGILMVTRIHGGSPVFGAFPLHSPDRPIRIITQP